MKWKRAILAAGIFAGAIWLCISVLGRFGSSGLAGPVVRNNLEKRTDATALFYTEIDGEILRFKNE